MQLSNKDEFEFSSQSEYQEQVRLSELLFELVSAINGVY